MAKLQFALHANSAASQQATTLLIRRNLKDQPDKKALSGRKFGPDSHSAHKQSIRHK